MKISRLITIAVLAGSLCACGVNHPHEKAAQAQAQQKGLAHLDKSRFDSGFVAPNTKFAGYKKIRIENLDLSQTKILKPTQTSASYEFLWELDDKDRAFYQDKYAAAAKKNLVESGLFALSDTTAPDTLVLKARLIEIAPLAPKDDFKSRPHLIDVYSEGFGRMTLVFELYDAANQLVYLSSDEHDLGKIWEKNNRVQNNVQVRLAFDYWLDALKDEFEKNLKK